MNYEGFKSARTLLANMVEGQLSVVRGSEYDSVVDTTEKPSMLLSETNKRLRDENLRVLVMGKFSSGKSTFLNGLLGRPLLPMSAIPTTAVIGEISYSETEKIVLFPKEGKWHGGDVPFEISSTELSQYITIDHSDSDNKENPFEKVIINSPLAICKNGIEFVDSPGLDDPTCHDAVTKEYLPTADAIIYCMTSQAAYSAKDRDEIDQLRSMGYTSIIFVMTFFDFLQENDAMMGTNNAQELKEHMLKTLVPLTDLGENGVFFVNSMAAIKGKVQHDEAMLQKSNFPIVEKRMEEILVNEKGRLKIIRSLYQTKSINRKNGKYISDAITLASNNHTIMEQQLINARQSLSQAQVKANMINQRVENGVTDIAKVARDRGELYLISDLIPNIEKWVNESNPEQGINVLHLRRSIKAYTEGVIDHMKSRISTSMNSWCKDSLVRDCIESQFSSLLIGLTNDFSAYQDDLRQVKVNLNLPINGEQIGDNLSPSAANRILSAGGSLLIGDIFGAITGGALGFRAMLTTLAAELTAGIVLGIVSLFTPVGIPALVISAVLAAAGAFTGNVLSIKSEVKKKISEETKKSLIAKKEEFSGQIFNAVKNALAHVQTKIQDELNGPINEAQALVDEAESNMNSDGVAILQKVNKLNQLKSMNEKLAANLDDFAETFAL